MRVTYTVMATCLALFGLSWFNPDLAFEFGLKPFLASREPWTLVTNAFFHDPTSTAHIGTNMLSLWIFGRMLETTIGSARFAGLLGTSILTGSIGVLLLENPYSYTVGISGGIFGLIAGVLVVQLTLKQNIAGTLVLLAVNALMPLMVANISWQGHLGGFLGGLIYSAAVILPWLRGRRRRHEPPSVV
jgi:membrane associated rhomboid family serine protease